MKTMLCKDLGGACDKELSVQTWNEMVNVMVKHVLENHPDVAMDMEKMYMEDSQKWSREMKPRWDAAPEV